MRVRFLADEDIRRAVVTGLRLSEPSIDILAVDTAGLKGTKDAQLLELAYQQGRVLVSYDRNTMARAFYERLGSGRASAGACIFPQDCPTGEVIEALLMVWGASDAEEWRNRLAFLPYR